MDENEEIFYTILYEPKEFVDTFKTLEEFRSFCETGGLEDLQEFLQVFESHELYEHCAVIKSVIDNM